VQCPISDCGYHPQSFAADKEELIGAISHATLG
jgi:hypothetical protein